MKHLRGQRTSPKLLWISFSPSQWGFFLFLHHAWFSILFVLSICCGLMWGSQPMGDRRGAAEGVKGGLYVLSLHQRCERSYHRADDIRILFHLLLSIFESTGKCPPCKTHESLISKAVRISEVPLAGWLWFPCLC